MNCPICGRQLKMETILNPRLTALYCENGDFCTDYYRTPSCAIKEAQSMIDIMVKGESDDERRSNSNYKW